MPNVLIKFNDADSGRYAFSRRNLTPQELAHINALFQICKATLVPPASYHDDSYGIQLHAPNGDTKMIKTGAFTGGATTADEFAPILEAWARAHQLAIPVANHSSGASSSSSNTNAPVQLSRPVTTDKIAILKDALTDLQTAINSNKSTDIISTKALDILDAEKQNRYILSTPLANALSGIAASASLGGDYTAHIHTLNSSIKALGTLSSMKIS